MSKREKIHLCFYLAWINVEYRVVSIREFKRIYRNRMDAIGFYNPKDFSHDHFPLSVILERLKRVIKNHD